MKSPNPYLEDDSEHDDGFGIGFSDTIINFSSIWIVLFFLMVVMLMIHKGKTDNITPTMESGDISIELSWPDDRNIDLDLWGRAPDGVSIGFSNPHGNYLDLVRDVVGFTNNPSHRNYEMMFGKKLIPGEWTFNVSYYGKAVTEAVNVPCTLTIRLKEANSNYKVLTTKFNLTRLTQEKTLFDFYLDNEGRLVESSVNSRDVQIVKGQKLL